VGDKRERQTEEQELTGNGCYLHGLPQLQLQNAITIGEHIQFGMKIDRGPAATEEHIADVLFGASFTMIALGSALQAKAGTPLFRLRSAYGN
jgi:hypothetical protein